MTDALTKDAIIKMVGILNKAILMERNAKEYYLSAAEITQSVEGKKMYLWLAEFEDSHERRLITRRTELLKHPAAQGESIPIDPDYDLSEADMSKAVPPQASEADVLQIGLENEHRVYAFLQKKITAARDDEIKEFFGEFATDTDKHIQILTDQLHSIKMNDIYKSFDESVN